jgi:hypothetical protein
VHTVTHVVPVAEDEDEDPGAVVGDGVPDYLEKLSLSGSWRHRCPTAAILEAVEVAVREVMSCGGGWGRDELRDAVAHVVGAAHVTGAVHVASAYGSRGGASAGGARRVLPQAGGTACVGDALAGDGVREMRWREVKKNGIGAIQ